MSLRDMFKRRRRRPGWYGFGALLAALLTASTAAAHTFDVHVVMSKDGSQVYFDPIGLHIQPGDTVRWIQVNGYHSVTAYHPSNGNHEQRIPEQAQPWDSTIMLGEYPAKGSTFEHKFVLPGVYDYFCQPHEAAGMVGRIIVGAPGDGPGTRPFGYAPDKHWNPVPEAAQKAFPAIQLILEKGAVRAPQATIKR
ncbi:MAG: plastocyanin/azurin family copper-binding protein [Burkholderiales bacterium]